MTEAVKTPDVEAPAEFDAAKIADEAKKEVEQYTEVAKQLMPPDALQVADAAKKQGVEVYAVQIGTDWFVYRGLSRFEYQQMLIAQSEQAEKLMTDAPNQIAGRVMAEMRGQNDVVLRASLYPKIDPMSIKEMGAGTVETLHNSIMLASGFGGEPQPFKL